ncbi:MAG: hypothetical protein DRP56_02100 [Planctomycetota bacterium]|nr:MAG: hypothetical protein DRP56_02100 [Planctomycetota bacterium]
MYAKQNTAVEIVLERALISSLDGTTPASSLVIGDITAAIYKGPTRTALTLTGSGQANEITEKSDGYAAIKLTAANTDTLGPMLVSLRDDDVFLAASERIMVMAANVYDSLFGSDKLQVDTREVSGTAQTANDNGADINAILADTNELQGNQSNWLTATGFSTHNAAAVWSVGTRTLTSFGSLVADIATSVWSAVSRTLTAGTKDSEINAIKAKTDRLNFDGDDVKATLDGESVTTDAASRTASKADVSGLATQASVDLIPKKPSKPEF